MRRKYNKEKISMLSALILAISLCICNHCPKNIVCPVEAHQCCHRCKCDNECKCMHCACDTWKFADFTLNVCPQKHCVEVDIFSKKMTPTSLSYKKTDNGGYKVSIVVCDKSILKHKCHKSK